MKRLLICLSILFSFLFISDVSAYATYNGTVFDEEQITLMAREAFNDNNFDPNNYYTLCTYYHTANPNYVIECKFFNTPVLSLTTYSSNNYFTTYNFDKAYSQRMFYKILNTNQYTTSTAPSNSISSSGNNLYSNFDFILDGNTKYTNLDFDTQTYNVNFYLNGGSITEPTENFFRDVDFSLSLNSIFIKRFVTSSVLEKQNMIFDGWYYDSNFTEPFSIFDDISTHSYNNSPTVEVNNLLDISQGYQLGNINSSNVFSSNNNNVLFNQYIYLQSGTTYSFSTKNIVNNMVISLYDSNNNFLGRVKEENTNNIVYTAGNNVSYVRFCINFDNGAITEQKINNAEIIVEEGSTRTDTSNSYSGPFEVDLYAKWSSALPDYLTGYKEVILTTNDKYIMISDVSSGSVFIPTQSFENYGGRLSYYDNDLTSQPYTSYIQDYTKMPDGEFIKQDFNLENYFGSDWVMFSKYIYLEGDDNISYSIWVPDDSFDSQVTITPNNQGGNDFDYEYVDENGELQNGQVSSQDLSQNSPLLGNVFEDFSSNTFGLTSIITAPLSLIRSLSSTSCTPLNLPLPFVGGTLTLPCMYDFYSNTFGVLFTLYQTITFGVVAYWVLVRIFNMVKDFKNPDHDEIEVVDL